jgi:hypothetical protein
VTISPEYFTLVKGFAVDCLRLQAAWLGFRSALPLGALATGVGLLRSKSALGFSWRKWITRVLLGAVVAAPAGALAMVLGDPFGVCSPSHEPACTRYLVTWGLHVGAYLGVLAGIGAAYLASRRPSATSR